MHVVSLPTEAVSDDELAAARDCARGAAWVGEEVASSERPELATAKVVVAGAAGFRVEQGGFKPGSGSGMRSPAASARSWRRRRSSSRVRRCTG